MKKYITSERPNLFEPNVYISLLAKIEGQITPEAVIEAVKAAYTANETTMSKIVLEEDGSAYYEKLTISGCKVFSDVGSFIKIIRKSEQQPFNIKDGELVRTFIIPETSGITLLIHAHHLAGDGKSILILLNDILDILLGKKPEYKPMTMTDSMYLEKRAKLPAVIKATVKRTNKKWNKTGQSFGWDDYYAVHKAYWSRFTSDFEIKSYCAAELKKCCTNGATVNDFLVTKAFEGTNGKKTVGIPVSIREEDNGMSNRTSGIALSYRFKRKQSFDKNLQAVHKLIRKKLDNENAKLFVLLLMAKLSPTFIDSVLMQINGCYSNPLSKKAADIFGYTGKNSRDFGITNLTRVDVREDNDIFSVSQILFIPPKVSYTKEVAGVETFKDKLTVCRHVMLLREPSSSPDDGQKA